MSTQRSFELHAAALASLWKRLPEGNRLEAMSIWARLIAAAAQLPKKKRGVQK